MNFRACGPKIQGSRFNGRPSVSKTESGGSNPSSPARLWTAGTGGRLIGNGQQGIGGKDTQQWPTQYERIEKKSRTA
jgi:hypothetical protein